MKAWMQPGERWYRCDGWDIYPDALTQRFVEEVKKLPDPNAGVGSVVLPPLVPVNILPTRDDLLWGVPMALWRRAYAGARDPHAPFVPDPVGLSAFREQYPRERTDKVWRRLNRLARETTVQANVLTLEDAEQLRAMLIYCDELEHRLEQLEQAIAWARRQYQRSVIGPIGCLEHIFSEYDDVDD
jgi:hypothetical protein